ncbi:hypothetical protein [Sinorhizobium sp. KGO-5]|uniref:hypothetical protein n=1 Tax=Sinorhizobium sp. KGO-5 TaxID=1470810 RepID=UPI0030C74BA1
MRLPLRATGKRAGPVINGGFIPKLHDIDGELVQSLGQVSKLGLRAAPVGEVGEGVKLRLDVLRS